MKEDQILWLNTIVKVKLASSKIHGVGVFALRDIPKGQKVYAGLFPQMYNVPFSSFGKLFPEVKELLLERWPQIVNGSNFAYPDTNIQAYMNHSEDANYDAKTDITLKDVKAGEELTEDYRKIEGYKKVFKWLK